MRTLAVVGLGLSSLVLGGFVLVPGPFDGSPPALSVDPPEGPVRGVVGLGVEASDERGVTLALAIDGAPPEPVTAEATVDTTKLGDGEHVLTVVATDGAWRRNTAETTWTLLVDNTAPRVSALVTPAAQGRTTAIFVVADEDAAVEVSMRQLRPKAYPLGERRWRALVGFEIEQPPGLVPLVVTATDAAGNVGRWEQRFPISATTFEAGGFVTLTPAQDRERRDVPKVEAMREQREEAFDAELPEQLWDGALLRPVGGRRTSTFGKYRSFQGGGRNHHNGVDLAAPRGTGVVASAAGVVTFAGPQPIYGNVVVVAHGHGVVTSYNHLDGVDVAAGDRVAAGQRVGRVGSTGTSTGPHLHWGLTVHGVQVDPEQWTVDAFGWDERVEQALAGR